MARFGLCGPDYRSASPIADAQRLQNWILEADGSGHGQSNFTLLPRPGLTPFQTVLGKKTRGQIEINGLYGFVVDDKLYQGFADGTSKLLNPNLPLANDGLPVTMATSNPTTGQPGQLLLASGGTAYVFDYTAQTLTALPASQFSGGVVSQVFYCDGFFIATLKNSNFWYVSQALNALLETGAFGESVFSENIVGAIVDHEEFIVWGSKHRAVHYVSGNPLFPFDTVKAGFDEVGSAARDAACQIDNSVFWIGADARGFGMGWRMEGYKSARITNHAEENLWQSFPRIDDAVGYAFQMNGHTFWVINFPSADRTRVYDVATGTWSEWTFLNVGNQPPTEHAHRSWNHQVAFGKHLVGDPQSGSIYQMALPVWNADQTAWLFADDFGNSIRRQRIAPIISRELKLIAHLELRILVETGLGPSIAFPGSLPAVSFNLQDANGLLWKVGVGDMGGLVTAPVASGTVQSWIFNDPASVTSWQLAISTVGVPFFTSIAFNPLGRNTFPMVSLSGAQQWVLAVTGIGQYTTTPAGPVTRGPLLMVSWSDDGTKTWSEEYQLDCGQQGDARQEVMIRGLGQSRGRNYRLIATDPIPWRIIDGFLQAPGFASVERMTQQMRKQA